MPKPKFHFIGALTRNLRCSNLIPSSGPSAARRRVIFPFLDCVEYWCALDALQRPWPLFSAFLFVRILARIQVGRIRIKLPSLSQSALKPRPCWQRNANHCYRRPRVPSNGTPSNQRTFRFPSDSYSFGRKLFPSVTWHSRSSHRLLVRNLCPFSASGSQWSEFEMCYFLQLFQG